MEGYITRFKEKADKLPITECEGSNYVWSLCKTLLRVAATHLRKRFRYLSLLPWCLVKVDEQEGAKEALRQWALRPPEDHDPVTVDFLLSLRVTWRGSPMVGPRLKLY